MSQHFTTFYNICLKPRTEPIARASAVSKAFPSASFLADFPKISDGHCTQCLRRVSVKHRLWQSTKVKDSHRHSINLNNKNTLWFWYKDSFMELSMLQPTLKHSTDSKERETIRNYSKLQLGPAGAQHQGSLTIRIVHIEVGHGLVCHPTWAVGWVVAKPASMRLWLRAHGGHPVSFCDGPKELHSPPEKKHWKGLKGLKIVEREWKMMEDDGSQLAHVGMTSLWSDVTWFKFLHILHSRLNKHGYIACKRHLAMALLNRTSPPSGLVIANCAHPSCELALLITCITNRVEPWAQDVVSTKNFGGISWLARWTLPKHWMASQKLSEWQSEPESNGL